MTAAESPLKIPKVMNREKAEVLADQSLARTPSPDYSNAGSNP